MNIDKKEYEELKQDKEYLDFLLDGLYIENIKANGYNHAIYNRDDIKCVMSNFKTEENYR
jgi:hypothetical protein